MTLSRYAGDEEATRAAFNNEGYYKTGDVAEIREGQYYFVGRADSDCMYLALKRFTPKPDVEFT
jgi:malonyl-CoA/methylmalonyl-CoA synthetase